MEFLEIVSQNEPLVLREVSGALLFHSAHSALHSLSSTASHIAARSENTRAQELIRSENGLQLQLYNFKNATSKTTFRQFKTSFVKLESRSLEEGCGR